MSVTSVPGFDVLSQASSSSALPGSDVLGAPVGSAGFSVVRSGSTGPATSASSGASSETPVASTPVAGSDVLSVPVGQAGFSNSKATTTAPVAATPQDTYQGSYNAIEAASNSYLFQSLGAPAIPSAPDSNNALSGDSELFSELQSGLAQGLFIGNGFDHSA